MHTLGRQVRSSDSNENESNKTTHNTTEASLYFFFALFYSWAGLERTGIHRQRFVAESLRDLRKSLRAIGSDLLILEGRPEDVFAKLLPRGSIIVTQKQVTQEEIEIDFLVKNAGFNLQTIWGLTMYDLRDIVGASGWGEGANFPSKSKIDSDIEKSGITPRPCLPTPHHGDLPFPATGGNDGDGNSDTADHLKLYDTARVQEPFLYADGTGERSVYDDKYTYQVDPRGVMGGSGSAALEFTKRPLGFRGGESAGLERVAYYLVKTRMSNFRSKRMYQMLGTDCSHAQLLSHSSPFCPHSSLSLFRCRLQHKVLTMAGPRMP